MNILFVCTGNTCRSPMAQAMFNELAKSRGVLKNFCADSAGIYVASDSIKPSANAVKVMIEEFNIDISGYKPKNISKELIDNADIILCMQESHKLMLQTLNIPEIEIDTLGNYVETPANVLDPYGGNENEYLMCAKNIKELIGLLMDKILKIKEEN